MLFSSCTFLFLFLPAVLGLYFLSKEEYRNHVLLFASLLFYGFGEPRYLVVMLLVILFTYCGAILVDRTKVRSIKKLYLTGAILLDLSFLIYFKYAGFIFGNLKPLIPLDGQLLQIIMPIGISFYTFQSISYLIDVYRHDVPAQRDFYKLALFITMFPQLIAGPIVKYHDIARELESRKTTRRNLVSGIQLFIIGLGKKVLLANTLGGIADKVFNIPVMNTEPIFAWMGAAAYSLQLFFDFSGYSDMAIGLGLIFGFHFNMNFNYPYISRSITEFWRRWHISLSTWFKEYLYIPLGGNRVSGARNLFNLFVVFLATGIWHGASWNFIVWGLWHGLFIIVEKLTGWHKKCDTVFLRLIHHVYTLLIVLLGWVFFRADNLSYGFEYVKNMFGLLDEHHAIYAAGYYGGTLETLIAIIAIIAALPYVQNGIFKPLRKYFICRAVGNAALLAMFFLTISFLMASTYNPFLYFRF